ncbi:MAG: hypothetical protein RIF33_16995 [Cyclobacteriaceae bacterium]
MIKFHYCRAYKKKVEGLTYNSVISSKFEDLSSRNRLVNTGNLHDYGNGLYSLKTHTPQAKIIIQKAEVDDNSIYFIRDIIMNKDLDFQFKNYVHPQLKSGVWLQENSLDERDIKIYKAEELNRRQSFEANSRIAPPTEVTEWLSDYKLNIRYDIFESEDWVRYALSESEMEGMRDKDVKSFARLIESVVDSRVENIDQEVLSKGSITSYSAKEGNFGIIFSRTKVEGCDRVILHNGAHLEKQLEHWEKALSKASTRILDIFCDIDSISRYAYRAYPKWTIKSDDLWFAIQKNDELSNLSLTQDQIQFFEKFKFPYYINGQAGSGKSTMLYYLFANAYFYKCTGAIKGEILFLTENEKLLEHTQKAVFDLLSNNPEFDGLNINHLTNLDSNFKSFKDFLLDQVPEEDKLLFHQSKYLDFSRFRELYEESRIPESTKRKFTAEESWFTIITYIFGYDSSKRISSELYQSEVFSKGRKIPLEKFKGVESNVLPFYIKLIQDEGYWDKLKVIRYLQKNKTAVPKYSVVICDEAQDFCRVELRFILKLSELLAYDLSQLDQVPVVFAGDPNQTVNPTEFREREMTEMLHTELKKLAHFDYNNDDSVYNPIYNYRSTQSVVSLANFVQYYRKKNFDVRLVRPQVPKRPDATPIPRPNLFFQYSNILEDSELYENLITKIKYKVFIVPVDKEEKSKFVDAHPILSSVEDADIKTSIEAKGAEYDQVVLYGFGEYYDKTFGELAEITNQSDDESFRRAFFFNKLYVGVTRAKKELIIIDNDSSKNGFWKSLVNKSKISDSQWEELNEFKDSTIVYNPDSLNNVISSSKEDALNNAYKDKEQGIYDSNSARLKVAANQFFKLGIKEEYFICSAIAESIKGNWEHAARLYLQAGSKKDNLEHAAKCFFSGQLFNDLSTTIGTRLKNTNQDVRVAISNLMQGNSLANRDIELFNNNRGTLRKLTRETSWRSQFIDRLIQDSSLERPLEFKRDLTEVYQYIAFEQDKELWGVIGRLSYELEEFERALDAWDRIDQGNTREYVCAKIHVASASKNHVAEVNWLGKLVELENSDEINKKSEDRIIQIYNSLENPDFNSPTFLFTIYSTLLSRQPGDHLSSIGHITEKAFEFQKTQLESKYLNLIKQNRLGQKAMDHAVYRWAKTKQLIAHELGNTEWLEELNQEYKELCKQLSTKFRSFTMSEINDLPRYPKDVSLVPPHHIKNISIKGFRRFSNITLEGLGQFNLIVGDNNVGKLHY